MRRTLVLSAFFIGYVLGFFEGVRTGKIRGTGEAFSNVGKGQVDALDPREAK